MPFPNFSDDPEPLDQEAPSSEQQSHLQEVLREYSKKMFDAYSSTLMIGEYLWKYLIGSFQPDTIRT